MRKILIKGTIVAALGALSITMAACGANPSTNETTSKTESTIVTRESGSRQKETQTSEKPVGSQKNEMQTSGSGSNKKQTSGSESSEKQIDRSQKKEMQNESEEGGMSESNDDGQAMMQSDSGTGNTQSSEVTK